MWHKHTRKVVEIIVCPQSRHLDTYGQCVLFRPHASQRYVVPCLTVPCTPILLNKHPLPHKPLQSPHRDKPLQITRNYCNTTQTVATLSPRQVIQQVFRCYRTHHPKHIIQNMLPDTHHQTTLHNKTQYATQLVHINVYKHNIQSGTNSAH